jgi:response regulator RpfG family c-di-GMP phosphodiesterase
MSQVRFPPAARLAERLLEAGKVEAAACEAAVTYMGSIGCRVEEALIEVNAISEAELLKYLATQHRTRFVSTEKLAKADIDRTTLDKVPKAIAERALIFPVLFDPAGNSLSVVTPDPDNLEALRDVQLASGVKEIKAFVARPGAVRAAISKAYNGDIHAFALLDRTAHAQFTSMLDVYERNLISDQSMSTAIAQTGVREHERTLRETDLTSAANSKAKGGANASALSGEAYLETLNVLVSLLENNRPDLRGHSGQVARLMTKMCDRVQLGAADANALIAASYLHDLGKMGTYHLTALNVSEYEGHTVAAEKSYHTPRRLMETCALSASTLQAIETMYERFDGKGVPGQLQGKEIPLGGRLLALVDTYADLTQNPRNPFRKTLRPLEACEILNKYRERIFDPNLVDLFKLTVTGDDIRGRLLGDRRLVLLVDPDPEETTVLELRLLQQGFLVKIARTAEQAIKALEPGEIDLVVSELDLVPTDGFALLTEARSKPWGKELLWILLTRRQGRSEAQKGFELGVVDYVSKPANVDIFIAKLRQLIDQRAMKSGPRGVSGSLSEMSLPDIVQVLWHGRKTGSLKVRSGNESGEIHFVDGQVYNALWGRLRGEEAFYMMVMISDGDFALNPSFKASTRVINDSPEALLLEAMRLMDEGSRG